MTEKKRRVQIMPTIPAELNDKIKALMAEHRWNLSQVCEYIIEYYFNEREK